MNIDLDKPLSFLTVGELLDLLNIGQQPKQVIQKETPEYVYGLQGLAKVLGCSKTTAWKVKKSGVLDEAITQRGRKIIIDKHLAIKLYNDVRN